MTTDFWPIVKLQIAASAFVEIFYLRLRSRNQQSSEIHIDTNIPMSRPTPVGVDDETLDLPTGTTDDR
ncbi:MAG TPA: hypothetical protein VG897_07290 [Terriglobales bacterium]|nr:hypothetical protein [Terriglobales bacterium]